MKIGIITINDDNNYGNRLQNYAVQETAKKLGVEDVETVKNDVYLNEKTSKLKYCVRSLKSLISRVKLNIKSNMKMPKRRKSFLKFNKNIKYSKRYFSVMKKDKKYDVFLVGSDQVWNPNFGRLKDIDLLNFETDAKKIAFSASFGVSKVNKEAENKLKKALPKFDAIGVREDAGKTIINNILPEKEVDVLVDPTMLLTKEDWEKVSKKPEMLKTDKYILNYFLGELSEERREEIDRVAKENGCEVINILDKNSPFYQTGPSEFLYLEKNAFAICTDSFHSCVFAILFNKPFIVFNRETATEKMNSRIDTLINKFELKNRKFENKVTEENLKHDYTKAYEILEKERKKSFDFLKKELNVEE